MLADPLSRKRRHFPKMEGRRFSVCAIIFKEGISGNKKRATQGRALFAKSADQAIT
ncbi:hypothetical protein [Rhizobium leguminosarum]|uniref:hypothetical protein n=1 Tax=Rhizobium leguminosarum TaxID=384 RepID=UPI001558E7B4|nr:hypothetical protein [Rhizobium leguminosarum]